MKRISYLLMVVVAIFLVAFVSAQDEEPTIAEIVVASTEAEEPEFTTLLAAIGLADELVLEALSDPEAEFTVFAPTDAAFAALAEALGEEAFAAILDDSDALTDILLYHVLEGAYYSEDVVDLLEELDGEVEAETLNGQYLYIEGDVEEGIYVDDAQIVIVDIEASNGVIHVIDAVLVPELRTIAEIVVDSTEAEEPEFTTLLGAIGLADEAVLEALNDADAELTVFAPTDAAFAALAEALGEEAFAAVLEDTELLTNILLYHVVPDIIYSDDVVELLEASDNEFEGEMLNGSFVTVTSDEDGIYINDAQIIVVDIVANNGVIHVIDAVLVPVAEEE